jgi:hypothetical protein
MGASVLLRRVPHSELAPSAPLGRFERIQPAPCGPRRGSLYSPAHRAQKRQPPGPRPEGGYMRESIRMTASPFWRLGATERLTTHAAGGPLRCLRLMPRVRRLRWSHPAHGTNVLSRGLWRRRCAVGPRPLEHWRKRG